MNNQYKAEQGDIIKLSFNPQAGTEKMGRRPALVVSSNKFNRFNKKMALVCPITMTDNKFPLNVNLNEETETSGVIDCMQVKSLDIDARKAEFVEKVPDEIIERVLEVISTFIDRE